MSNEKMALVLKRAAALVRTRIAKGVFAQDVDGVKVGILSEEAAAFCARGALKRVLGVDEWSWEEQGIQREVERDLRIGVFHPDFAEGCVPDDEHCLGAWNNADERTGDEVADAFLKTAARLDGGK